MADLDLEAIIVKLWCDFTLFWLSLVGYLDLLNCEAIVRGAVLAELGSKNCETNLTLHEVGARYLNEHILGVEADFGLLTVYDRGQRQHLPILVVEDRVLIKTIQDWDELLHLHVRLKHFKQFLRIHALSLLESLELDIFRRYCLIGYRCIRRKFIQVMSSHRSQCAPPTNVLVEFILQVNK